MILQDWIYILIGFLAGALASAIYFRNDIKKHRKETDEKLKFLDENPKPIKGVKYGEREN